MNKKNIFIASMAVVLGVLWYFTTSFLNAIEIGPNPEYIFSPNYIMVKGHLYFYPDPSNYDHYEVPMDEYIHSFLVERGWLLGKTDKGYFAINMQNNDFHYPISSEQELAALADLTLKQEDWADSYEKQITSKYLQRNSGVHKFHIIVNIVFVALSIILLWGLLRRSKTNKEKTKV